MSKKAYPWLHFPLLAKSYSIHTQNNCSLYRVSKTGLICSIWQSHQRKDSTAL